MCSSDLTESIIHAGASLDARVNLKWIDSEKIEPSNVEELLKDADGVLVAGGFGERGVNGKIEAIKYARENGVPYLGISREASPSRHSKSDRQGASRERCHFANLALIGDQRHLALAEHGIDRAFDFAVDIYEVALPWR